MPDALQVLREDHNKVKEMFQRFERSDDRSEKKKIAEEAIMELEVHAQIEEEIFYPAMRKQLGNNELLHEAEEEHHVAKMLMEELQTMRLNDKTFDAKFTVLAENVKHHIGEEEGEMFPKATEAGRAVLDRVGQQLTERKVALMDEMRSAPRKRRAATGSRSGARTRTGRTARTTAGSRTTTTSRTRPGAAKPRTSTGTRSTSAKRTTRAASGRTTRAAAGTRSRAATTRGTRSSRTSTARGTPRSAATRSRTGGSTRARTTSTSKRATTKRGTGSRSRR